MRLNDTRTADVRTVGGNVTVRRRGGGGRCRVGAGVVILLLAVVSAVLAGPPSPASAVVTTWYVGGSNCSDQGAGTTAQPFCTIQQGAAVAQPGDTVLVAAGSYTGGITPPRSGTSTAPITFRAAGNVVISGSNTGFVVTGLQWIVIEGFQITGTPSSGIQLTSSTLIVLRNNTVTGAGQPVAGLTAPGISVSATNYSVVTGNTVMANTTAGIYITNGSTRNTIQGNTAVGNARGYERGTPGIDIRSPGNIVTKNITHDNEDSGIQLYPGADNTLVASNVSYNNKGFSTAALTNCDHPATGNTAGCITGDHGIDQLGVANNRVIGNTVYGNATAGINAEGASSNVTIEDNISADNGADCPDGAGGTTTCPRNLGNIRIDATSQTGAIVDHDLVWMTRPGPLLGWGAVVYTSLPSFQTASGQESDGQNADPRFVAPASGDFHLLAGSPAIDSADASVPSFPTSDQAGQARVDDPSTVDRGVGTPPWADLGAYEYQPPTVPGRPTIGTATPGPGQATVTWTAPGSDGGAPITGYVVTPFVGATAQAPRTFTSTATAQIVTGLTSGTAYTFKVAAINAAGTGTQSSASNAVTPSAPISVPGAPTGVAATAGNGQASLTWTAPTSDGGSPITGYVVTPFVGTTAKSPQTFTSTATTQTVTGLSNGTAYTFTVTATNAVGSGPPSAPSNAVTPVSLTSAQKFVLAAYSDFLGRPPTAQELSSTSSAIDTGTRTRQQVVDSLAVSPEWVTNVVNKLYVDTLGRQGDPGGVAYWIQQIRSGAQSVTGVASYFYASPEYYDGIGGGTVTSWVTDLYHKLLLRNPDPGGLNYWVGQTSSTGRVRVATRFYQSSESAHTRVNNLYLKLLGRPAEPGGADYWAGRVISLGDITLAADLAASPEYYQRAQTRYP